MGRTCTFILRCRYRFRLVIDAIHIPQASRRPPVTHCVVKPPVSTDLRYSRLGPLIQWAYTIRRLRRFCLALLLRLEGGEFYSGTLRLILKRSHGVQVGAFSYGTCTIPGAFPEGVVVGRYVSVGPNVRVFLRNHPLDTFSLHPFFYNCKLG